MSEVFGGHSTKSFSSELTNAKILAGILVKILLNILPAFDLRAPERRILDSAVNYELPLCGNKARGSQTRQYTVYEMVVKNCVEKI